MRFLYCIFWGFIMLATASGSLPLSIGMVLLSMYIIKYACDSFEDASDYLGTQVYKMAPGIRGATIEAIASSLPVLHTGSSTSRLIVLVRVQLHTCTLLVGYTVPVWRYAAYVPACTGTRVRRINTGTVRTCTYE